MSSLTIHSLPAELLSLIFLVAAGDVSPHTKVAVPIAAPLSHVCAGWRASALACQLLWSRNIPCATRKWTDICISRCPSVDLDVSVVYKDMDPEYRRATNRVLLQAHRARSLRLYVEYHAFMEHRDVYEFLAKIFDALNDGSPPHLTEVSFEFNDGHDGEVSSVYLSSNFFSKWSFPSIIRKIVLQGCTLPGQTASLQIRPPLHPPVAQLAPLNICKVSVSASVTKTPVAQAPPLNK